MITLAAKEDKLKGELDHRYSFQEIENTAAALGLSAGNGQKIILEKGAFPIPIPVSASSKRSGKNSLLMNALYGRLRNLIKFFK